MKTSGIVWLATGVLAFGMVSCQKQVLNESFDDGGKNSALSQRQSKSLNVTSINELGEIRTYTMAPPSTAPSERLRRTSENPNAITNAAFRTASGNKYNISGIVNKDGVSGEWQINHQVLGKVYVKTACNYIEGNTSAIAGVVTEVERPGAMALNYFVILRLRDNGEGGNADPDQVSSSLLYFFNWFETYDTLEDFLVDFNCENLNDDPRLASFIDIKGQVQVK